ncbi:FUSC family protein [Sphingopyxis yananensis]|uniref:FUSC family protein n=1 Tax=Sphingopyxis yananensis TaxID=2886687 RepID=UPI001D126939|nr:FUSC family protein [Sphingopyxis yananensis]MCC2603623.1 FUSC family protein [Sphingopyxis yananensis]
MSDRSNRARGRSTWPVRRVDAVRHLLHPRQMRDSLRLTRQPFWRNASLAGMQSALAAAIALPLVYLSPWSHLIGYAALGALVALFGRFAPERSRNSILFLCVVVQTFAVFIMSAAGWLGMPLLAMFIILALACGVFFFIAAAGSFGPPGPLIFIFAAGAGMSHAATFQQVLERSAATASVALLAWAICAASETFRHHPAPDLALPAERSPSLRPLLIASARSAFAAAVAIFAAHALGADYPVWAAMGALAVMQGAHLHLSMNRAIQRMAGTVVGALLVWFILDQNPSIWTVFGLLVILQYATELIIGSNYALGQILVTPMALLMTHLAAPHMEGRAMVSERVTDTLLGAAIGIVIAVAWSSLEDRHRLARYVAQRRSSS